MAGLRGQEAPVLLHHGDLGAAAWPQALVLRVQSSFRFVHPVGHATPVGDPEWTEASLLDGVHAGPRARSKLASGARIEHDARRAGGLPVEVFARQQDPLADGTGAISLRLRLRGPLWTSYSYRCTSSTPVLARFASLVPPPRHPLVRTFGVLSSASRWRRHVVPKPGEAKAKEPQRPGVPQVRGQAAFHSDHQVGWTWMAGFRPEWSKRRRFSSWSKGLDF